MTEEKQRALAVALRESQKEEGSVNSTAPDRPKPLNDTDGTSWAVIWESRRQWIAYGKAIEAELAKRGTFCPCKESNHLHCSGRKWVNCACDCHNFTTAVVWNHSALEGAVKLCAGGCGRQTASHLCTFCAAWDARAACLKDLDAMQIRSLERSGGNSDVVPAIIILVLVAIVAVLI